MKLRDALHADGPASVITAVVLEALDQGFGGRAGAPASLPERPGDGSLMDALLSPDVLGSLREMARAAVAQRKSAMKGAMAMKQRQAMSRPSLAVIEATSGLARGRLSHGGRQFDREAAVQSAAGVERPRNSRLRVLEAMDEQRAAAPTATPLTGRPVRDVLAARGCSDATLEALGLGGDAA